MTDVPHPVIPSPDPSVLTTEAMNRLVREQGKLVATQLEVRDERINSLRQQLTERLDAMDKATVVLADNVNRVPTNLQTAMKTSRELNDVKFEAIADKFELLDKQTVREKAAADLALAAAFDAQKEAAAATNNANAEAIRKSELATAETIKTNADAQRSGSVALSDKIDDVKDRMNRLEQLMVSVQSSVAGGSVQRENTLKIGAFAVSVLLLVLTGFAVYAALRGH